MKQIFFTLSLIFAAEKGAAVEWWNLKNGDAIFFETSAGSIKLKSVKTSPNSHLSSGEIPYQDPSQAPCLISIRNPKSFSAVSGSIKWKVTSFTKEPFHYNLTGQIGETSVDMFIACPGPAGPSSAIIVQDASDTRKKKARLGHK